MKKNRDAAARAVVFGVVQGVGFRPFVFRLARGLGLRGWVKNAGSGVEIHVEGSAHPVRSKFFGELRRRLPPLARIEKLEVQIGRAHV